MTSKIQGYKSFMTTLIGILGDKIEDCIQTFGIAIALGRRMTCGMALAYGLSFSAVTVVGALVRDAGGFGYGVASRARRRRTTDDTVRARAAPFCS